MSKFKVGDRVKFIEKYGIHNEGDIVRVLFYHQDTTEPMIEFEGEHGKSAAYEKRFKLYNPKTTKNQRITALENKVNELEEIVEQLRKSNITIEDVEKHFNKQPVQRQTVPCAAASKTNNELRAEVIEKAKKRILNINGKIHFFVNEPKRTVVAVLKDYWTDKEVIGRGIAKCMPGDVFNEHIGKAIALCRALGVDVSEFEQAVQPTIAVGQVATHECSAINYEITEIYGDTYYTKPGSHYHKSSFEVGTAYIINDTNAQYGGAN